MYELILFDADGTIFDFRKAEAEALEKSFRYYKYEGPLDDIKKDYHIISKDLWSMLEKGKMSVDKLRTERFKRLFTKIGQDYPVSLFSEFYLDRLSEGGYLIQDALQVCERLSKKYRLGILTNGIDKVQKARLENSELKAYFEFLVSSGGLGISKPDPRVFEQTLKKANHINKKSVLMIGDSLTSDIQGGINAGIDTCWYNPEGMKNTSGIKATYEIRKLVGLNDIL